MFSELSNLLNTSPDKVEQAVCALEVHRKHIQPLDWLNFTNVYQRALCMFNEGKLTLLCDVKTDGSFLVHHFLSFYLKAHCKVCFVALTQSFSHYNIVGQKLMQANKSKMAKRLVNLWVSPGPLPVTCNQVDILGLYPQHMEAPRLGVQLMPQPQPQPQQCQIQASSSTYTTAHGNTGSSTHRGVSLTIARERGQLVFLEGLKSAMDIFFRPQEEPHPLQFLRDASAGNLQPLYEFVQDALKPVANGEATWRCPVLLVDDLSVLLSLGVGAVAVLDFIHYCRATVCWEWKGNIVALVHDSGDTEDEENDILLNGLSHQSHLILRAEGLATGFCKDVHGQLSVLWRRPLQPTSQRDQSLTYQYKIQDKNVSFFAKGMSPAVL